MSDRYNGLMGTGAAAVDPRELDALASGTCANPFSVLGRHATVEGGLPALVVRTIQPRASSVELVANGRAIPMTRRLAAQHVKRIRARARRQRVELARVGGGPSAHQGIVTI